MAQSSFPWLDQPGPDVKSLSQDWPGREFRGLLTLCRLSLVHWLLSLTPRHCWNWRCFQRSRGQRGCCTGLWWPWGKSLRQARRWRAWHSGCGRFLCAGPPASRDQRRNQEWKGVQRTSFDGQCRLRARERALMSDSGPGSTPDFS